MSNPIKLHAEQAFPIEKGMPIPGYHSGGRTAKYPWRELEIDDSFFVPGKIAESFGATEMAKRYGIKVISRTVDGGVRVWRTE